MGDKYKKIFEEMNKIDEAEIRYKKIINQKVAKAKDETTKVTEIQLINKLENENKKIEYSLKLENSDLIRQNQLKEKQKFIENKKFKMKEKQNEY